MPMLQLFTSIDHATSGDEGGGNNDVGRNQMNQHVTGVAVAGLLWSRDAVSSLGSVSSKSIAAQLCRSSPRKGQPAVVRIADTAVPPMVVSPW